MRLPQRSYTPRAAEGPGFRIRFHILAWSRQSHAKVKVGTKFVAASFVGAVGVLTSIQALAQGTYRNPEFVLEDVIRTPVNGQFVLSADGQFAVHATIVGGRYFGHPLITRTYENGQLRLVSLVNGETTILTGGSSPKTNPRFSPDGTRVTYQADYNIWAVDVDSGKTVRLTADYMRGLRSRVGATNAAWSPDGRRIAFVSRRLGWAGPQKRLPQTELGPRIWVMSADGESADLTQVTKEPVGASDLSWSPSGKKLLFVARGEHFFSRRIFVVSTSGGTPIALTPDDDSWNRMPRWSPDGSKIAFVSDRLGYRTLWIMQADGSEPREVFGVEQDHDYNHSVYLQTKGIFWSPDGTRILCFAIREGNLDVFVVAATEGSAKRVGSEDGMYHPVGWVDNNTIAYVFENYHTPPDMYVAPLDGVPRKITHSRRAVYRKEYFGNLERVSITAKDGLQLHGFLHTPTERERGRRHPAVVFLHTYCPGQNYNEWDPFFYFLVESGYVMLRLDHRGSSGYGRRFLEAAVEEHGGKVVEDVLAGARFLRNRPEVDPNRLAVMGYSYGGSLAKFALSKGPDLFQAGISVFGTADRRGRHYPPWWYYVGGREEDVPDRYEAASPITYVNKLAAPLLILGGKDDVIVDGSQTYGYVDALRNAGKYYELVMYPGEQHGLRDIDNQIDSYRRVINFLNRFLNY